MRSKMLLGFLVGALCAGGVGCGGGDGGAADTPFPEDIDCEMCAEDEVCWYTTDFDGTLHQSGCLDLPADCQEDRSCDCVNASDESVCDQVGWVQNGDACETIEDIPVVECISTLG
jgi:hypothetical protein